DETSEPTPKTANIFLWRFPSDEPINSDSRWYKSCDIHPLIKKLTVDKLVRDLFGLDASNDLIPQPQVAGISFTLQQKEPETEETSLDEKIKTTQK
ncbi:MAG: hypothetical protein LBF22_12660, partial [Deltaproteobacteria bacterium]|nr:hypothetical protein [Deltaproteobacteria bacterium]